MAGIKFDDKKLRHDLVPVEVIEALASVLQHGAEKYGDDNWQQGINFRRIYSALQRHLTAWRKGQYFDEDSGLPVLWHALAELSFLIYFEQHGYQDFNDFMDEWQKRSERNCNEDTV